LGDVTKTVIRAWTQLGDTYGFQAHADGVCEGLVLPWDRAGHLCQVTCTLTRKTEGDEDEGPNSEVRFVLPCEAVAALAEKVTIVQQMSPEQVSQTIAQRLQDYPVCIRGEVGRTTLRFQEIMELREQDVVVLDRSIREPIDVVVVGRSVFRAVLGQSQGRQALQIVAAPARGESVS
jgi:flagellar motor switch protein FliM